MRFIIHNGTPLNTRDLERVLAAALSKRWCSLCNLTVTTDSSFSFSGRVKWPEHLEDKRDATAEERERLERARMTSQRQYVGRLCVPTPTALEVLGHGNQWAGAERWITMLCETTWTSPTRKLLGMRIRWDLSKLPAQG